MARGHEERARSSSWSLVYGWMYASPQQVGMLSADGRHHGMACRAYSLASGAALTRNTTYGMTDGFQLWVQTAIISASQRRFTSPSPHARQQTVLGIFLPGGARSIYLLSSVRFPRIVVNEREIRRGVSHWQRTCSSAEVPGGLQLRLPVTVAAVACQ